MQPAAANIRIPGANTYHGAPRLSAKGVAVIVALHAGILALLASFEVVPLPAPLATLMVEVIAPAPPPAPAIVPPRPTPVERKPTPVPKPVAKPVPQTLAAQTQSNAAAEAPVVKAPPPAAPAPAPAVPTVSQPRFDADYLLNPAPAYPPMSRRLGEEGKVVLRVFVEPSGRPSQVEVKTGSGSERLDQAARDAVWRWKFIPAKRGDETVGAWVLVPIAFNLRG